ncbi:MAG TPA: hypothetical protein VGN88_11200 [Phycisphaerae bacterium]|jgi:hypothetical protein
MTVKALAQAFAALRPHDQAELLAGWGYALTIDARDTYIPGTQAVADPVRLRGFNEIEHRVCGQLRAILNSVEERYSDEGFFGMLVDTGKELHAGLLLQQLEEFWSESSQGSRGKRRAG